MAELAALTTETDGESLQACQNTPLEAFSVSVYIGKYKKFLALEDPVSKTTPQPVPQDSGSDHWQFVSVQVKLLHGPVRKRFRARTFSGSCTTRHC